MSFEAPSDDFEEPPEPDKVLEVNLVFLLGRSYRSDVDIKEMLRLADAFQSEIEGYRNKREGTTEE